eukprot:Phypoly_transcript_10024.p1 GENE.Phypoly_transcript_10024~~Phypoly_transcript_10024.p1  ORF type:complete len:397 (+),score=41.02 Phypoly_transcript_10024:116-1306(+)
MRTIWIWLVVLSVIVGLGLQYPRYTQQDADDTYAQYKNLLDEMSATSSRVVPFPVMTFNMRHDILEHDLRNNFTNRIDRIDSLIRTWKPLIIGLQEPFKSQIARLKKKLPKHYKPIGHGKLPSVEQSTREDEALDITNPRKNDYSTAILYNSEVLSLEETDYVWLSTTPTKEDSVDWNSYRPRTLNIARFRHKNGKSGQDIIAFNTHLDRWGEWARREQAKVVKATIEEWEKKYPEAAFLLFGDFNTAPGQDPHKTLTSIMEDSWIWCKEFNAACVSNNFSSSFHGWYGSVVNSWIFRAIQVVTFTVHGMGVSPPSKHRTISEIAHDFMYNAYPLKEAIPHFPFDRLHVDWILFKNTKSANWFFPPSFVSVVDVRSSNFSSDHFPIVALFSLRRYK